MINNHDDRHPTCYTQNLLLNIHFGIYFVIVIVKLKKSVSKVKKRIQFCILVSFIFDSSSYIFLKQIIIQKHDIYAKKYIIYLI